jgi:hypothetical protein
MSAIMDGGSFSSKGCMVRVYSEASRVNELMALDYDRMIRGYHGTKPTIHSSAVG